MAIEIKNRAQTKGTSAQASLPFTAATAGSILVAFVAQTGSSSAPTATGWSTNATKANGANANNGMWVMTKEAEGGEAELKPTAGSGGLIQGISYQELFNATTTLRSGYPMVKSTPGTVTSEFLSPTTGEVGDALLGASGGANASMGAPKPWAKLVCAPALSNNGSEAESTRCVGGSAVLTTGFTSEGRVESSWTTGQNVGLLVICLLASTAQTFTDSGTGTINLTGTGADVYAPTYTDSGTGTIEVSGTRADEYKVGANTEYVDSATGTIAVSSGEGTADEYTSTATGVQVSYGAGPTQVLTKWPAPEGVNVAPIAVLVHGGGWAATPLGPEYRVWNAKVEAWQNVNGKLSKTTNVAAAIIEYHQAESESAAFPQAVEDTVKAVEWVIEHAAQFNGDKKRVFLCGISAGGSVAAMAAQILGNAILGVQILSPFETDVRKMVEEVENETGAGPEINGNAALTKHWQEALQQNKPGSTFIKTPGALKSNEPAARTFQEAWSVNHRAITGSAAWQVWSSIGEVVSPEQAAALQTYLEAQGKWDARCKRILRTANTNASHPNNFSERQWQMKPTVGTLSSPLSTSSPITTLPVAALPWEAPAGAELVVHDGSGHSQVWVVAATAAKGATSIAVAAQTPNFAYPTVGTSIQEAALAPHALGYYEEVKEEFLEFMLNTEAPAGGGGGGGHGELAMVI
jgi:acetyl esterase/lipase